MQKEIANNLSDLIVAHTNGDINAVQAYIIEIADLLVKYPDDQPETVNTLRLLKLDENTLEIAILLLGTVAAEATE